MLERAANAGKARGVVRINSSNPGKRRLGSAVTCRKVAARRSVTGSESPFLWKKARLRHWERRENRRCLSESMNRQKDVICLSPDTEMCRGARRREAHSVWRNLQVLVMVEMSSKQCDRTNDRVIRTRISKSTSIPHVPLENKDIRSHYRNSCLRVNKPLADLLPAILVVYLEIDIADRRGAKLAVTPGWMPV